MPTSRSGPERGLGVPDGLHMTSVYNQSQGSLSKGLFLAWRALFFLEGNCVTIWVGKDTDGTRRGGSLLRGVCGAQGQESKMTAPLMGTLQSTLILMRKVSSGSKIEVNLYDHSGPTPARTAHLVKSLRWGTFWPPCSDHGNTGPKSGTWL